MKTFEKLMDLTKPDLIKEAQAADGFEFEEDWTKEKIAKPLAKFLSSKMIQDRAPTNVKPGRTKNPEQVGKYIVETPIKEDGKRYVKGDDYTGRSAAHFKANGQIRKKD